MKIMIDISDKLYEYVVKGRDLSEEQNDEMAVAIEDGTPLPENHGRLIDADEVISIMFSYMSDKNKNHEAKYVMSVAKAIVENVSTIIEASES